MKEILDVKPDFTKITDMDLIGLLSYCEDWLPERVYDTAYSQVFPEQQVLEVKKPFGEWLKGPKKLPDIVRFELVRAAYINYEAGKMRNLKIAYFTTKIFKNSLVWSFIGFIFWWWFL